MQQCRLYDMAATAVTCQSQEIGLECLDNHMAVLRRVLKQGLYNIVSEAVPADVLCFCQDLPHQFRNVCTGTAVLDQSTEDAAAKPVLRSACSHTEKLLSYEA
mmetsp:Transcript_18767/g.25260  ORF Transcript_18767/g.25260 Transcript_18767/m.25260 type:complete len:103 (-) Transcript_18767:150-458(-)